MKKTYCCLFVAGLVMSFTSWADVRPLAKRSAEECNPAYLEAIKPTPAENAWLFQTSLESVLGSLYGLQENERWLEGFKRQYDKGIISRETYESLRKQRQELISEGVTRRDQCWNYAEGLKVSAESVNFGLLKTAMEASGLRMATALTGKLLTKGASIDASLPLAGKQSLRLSPTDGYAGRLFATGALFPLMVKGALGQTSDKQFRLDFVRFLLANIKDPKTINARADDIRSGPTALAFAVEAGNDNFINLLLDAGADPRIPNQEGKGVEGKNLIDIYTGKDVGVIKRLSGVAIKFNRPEVRKISGWNDVDGASDTKEEEAPVNVQTNSQASAGSFPSALVTSYSGVVRSSLQPNQPIAAKGQINSYGQFEYIGNNGVVMRGTLDASGTQILGKGVSRLPVGLNGAIATYPNGADETDITLTAQFDGQVLRGQYGSKFETGTFNLCVPASQANPLCAAKVPNPVGDLLKGLNGFLGGVAR